MRLVMASSDIMLPLMSKSALSEARRLTRTSLPLFRGLAGSLPRRPERVYIIFEMLRVHFCLILRRRRRDIGSSASNLFFFARCSQFSLAIVRRKTHSVLSGPYVCVPPSPIWRGITQFDQHAILAIFLWQKQRLQGV